MDKENQRHTPPFLDTSVQAPGGGTAVAQQKSIFDYLVLIKRWWWVGALVGLIAGGALYYQEFRKTPLYRTTAIILFEQETDRVLNIQEVVTSSLRGLVDTILRNHLIMMRSNGFRNEVIASLTPQEREIILAPYRDPASDEDPNIAAIIAGANNIHRAGDNVFNVQFEHRSGEAAALLANRFIEAYNQYLVDRRREGNTSAIRFLRARAEELRLRVEQSELELQQYRQNADLVSLDENQNLVASRLQALDSSLTAARLQLLQFETYMHQIETAQEAGRDLTELTFIAGYGRVGALKEQVSQVRTARMQLEQRYGNRHPVMVENQAALNAAEHELQVQIGDALTRLNNDLTRQRNEVERLEEALKQAEAEVMRLDKMSIEYNVLKEKLQSDRQLFQQVLSRLNETSVASQLSLTNLRTVDLAPVPATPFTPDIGGALGKAIFVLLAAVLAVPFAIEFIDKRIRSYKDVELHLRRSCLGTLRRFSLPKGVDPGRIILNDKSALMSDYFRMIYGQAEIASKVDYPKVILVASSLPQEGKSFFVSQFAAILSRHNRKVLILDADLRKPAQCRAFGVENDTGLIPWHRNRDATRPPFVSGRADVPPIHHLAMRLYLMPTGGSDEHPSEIFSSRQFEQMLDYLKSQYDVILIDSPPAALFPEARLLSNLADEFILIVKYKAVTRTQVRRILRSLEEARARNLGVVMNFSKKDASPSAGKYEKYYRKYYSSEESGKKTKPEASKKNERAKRKGAKADIPESAGKPESVTT